MRQTSKVRVGDLLKVCKITCYLMKKNHFQELNISGSERESEFQLQFRLNHKVGKIFCPEEFGHVFRFRS